MVHLAKLAFFAQTLFQPEWGVFRVLLRSMASVHRSFQVWINEEKSFFDEADLGHIQGVAKLSVCDSWGKRATKRHRKISNLSAVRFTIKSAERYES